MSDIKRIVLFGDNIGIPQSLRHIPNHKIVGIVAAELRPQYFKEVSDIAQKHNITFLTQPRFGEKERYKTFVKSIKELEPDCFISNSYSMLIRQDLLSLTSGKSFNLHYSLLPRHRGPNPIQWALIHGDKNAGVTLHVLDTDFDNGEIVDQIKFPIHRSDTWVTLMEKSFKKADLLLSRTIPEIISQSYTLKKQDPHLIIKNSRIPPESFEINLQKMTDIEIYNLIRAQVYPLKGPFLILDGKRVHFDKLIPLEEISKLRNHLLDN